MDLTQRQRMILKTVVEEFIRTAQPIGSKSLLLILGISVSSATIRNDLSVLEKEGLIEKTHISSGRIPSPNGYRYYVEHLMELHLDSQMEEALRQVFSKRHLSLEEMIQVCCSLLAEMTKLTSIALQPEPNERTLEHIGLIPLSENQALAVITLSDGQCETRLLPLDESVSREDLKIFTQLLDANLQGTPLANLFEKMESIKPLVAAYTGRHEVLFQAWVSALMSFACKESVIYGRANMLMQPEFANVSRLEQLMRVLDNQNLFQEWTARPDRVSIPIDQRSELIQIGDCCVVTTKFEVKDGEQGQLMVIGPNRMPYGKVIALMDYLSKQIEEMFGNQ